MTDQNTPSPEELRRKLIELAESFGQRLRGDSLREKVISLIPVYHTLRRLGTSLIDTDIDSARGRILHYFRQYPRTVIKGDELMVVAGISEWARRVRELRVQFGWQIISGIAAKEMSEEGDKLLPGSEATDLHPDDYILLETEQDRSAAYRWNIANTIRRQRFGVRDKLLLFLRENVGAIVSGEELRYVARNSTEWARRIRELRTELGWPIVTRYTGRPDLPVGTYILEQDRQSPEHDRNIPDAVRGRVLKRDGFKCTNPECGWTTSQWDMADPRNLELHHVRPHVQGGSNDEENLVTLCSVCHDEIHRRLK